MTMRVVPYHFPRSLRSQSECLTLYEKGVEYTFKLVNVGPPMENYESAYAPHRSSGPKRPLSASSANSLPSAMSK